MEIERRFLVKNVDAVRNLIREFSKSRERIVQDYLYSDRMTAIRRRKIEKNGNTSYIYTVKTGRKGISINEYEDEITEDMYNSFKLDSSRITIDKDRYVIPYIGNLVIELDIFHGVYEGVIFAEIEYESEEQAKNTPIPEWFDREISNEISNSKMSKEPELVLKMLRS